MSIFVLNMLFAIEDLFPFPLSSAKWIGDYFDIKGCGQTIMQWHIEVPCVNGDADRILSVNHEPADFFLVRVASLFTLRRFGAEINWRVKQTGPVWSASLIVKVIAYKFAVTSGKGNKIFNQKLHVQTVHKPRSPRSETIIPNIYLLLDPPFLSSPTTFKLLV